MNEKETGAKSSPVDQKGIKYMENSFFKTKKLATHLAKRRLDYFEAILGRKCQNILDVGCGPGVFYAPYSNLSVNWEGVEINKHWIHFGEKNKIPIKNKNLEKMKTKYDIITAYQVLEHVEDPNYFIKQIKNRLKKDGLLHLELPNHNSLTSKIRKISPYLFNDYGFIQPPMHMRAYTIKSLKSILIKHDFNIDNIFTCANNDRIWGQVRSYSLLRKIFYKLTSYFGLGSILIGLAKNNDH